MTRAPRSEVKRQSSLTINGAASNPRLAAAGTRALEAHARVRRSAEHLGEELDEALEHVTLTNGIPMMELDPEDSMVIAVEKVITTAKSTSPPPFRGPEVSTPRTSTKPGVAPLRKPTGG
jgi:hypothetical protein